MEEVIGDIWKYHELGYWIVIPTNGFVKKESGECVMGRGLALQAKLKFPKLPFELGALIDKYGNCGFVFPQYRLFSFPVKHNWWESADIELIKQSCEGLVVCSYYNWSKIPQPIYLPRVGCGNGKLRWKDVKPVIEEGLKHGKNVPDEYNIGKFVICSQETDTYKD